MVNEKYYVKKKYNFQLFLFFGRLIIWYMDDYLFVKYNMKLCQNIDNRQVNNCIGILQLSKIFYFGYLFNYFM